MNTATISTRAVRLLASTALCGILTATAGLAQAQTTAASEPLTLDSIIVTGTRDADRTLFETLSPVDIVEGDAIEATVSSDLSDSLAQLIPSFIVQRLPAADGLAFVRPATLRSLSPDHTLVLVNGKRFHRSALLGSRGAQGPDLSQIPSFAISRVEVLRDGASAQYGSDAIAGVINIVLDDTPGLRLFSQYSSYFEGDGSNPQFGIQGGVPVGDRGFVSATLQYSDAAATSRTRQRADAISFQAANPTLSVPNPVQRWGQPDLQTLRFALNGEIGITEAVEAYGFLTYGEGEGTTDFNWRNPAGTPNVFRASTAFPGFLFNSIYPTGFTPRFGQEDRDMQIVAGVRSQGAAFDWDFSASHGNNEIDYRLTESLNASLGPLSPLSFQPGTLRQEETNLNADFVYRWALAGLEAPINLAFGVEWREEVYKVTAGDPASYAIGPGANTGLASGSNGFPGYAPDQAGRWSQDSWAAYVDVEVPLTERLTLGAAVRQEDFSTFGSTTDGKLSARFTLTPNLALRASGSTGFRAPTPGQVNSTRTSQGLDTVTLQVFTSGRLSPENPVSQFFGARPLEPEEAENLTAGLTWRTDYGFSGSIDLYRVDLTNRFGQSSSFAVTPAVRAQLVAAGVPGANTFTSISFFTNDFDTRTEGVDIVGAYERQIGDGRFDLDIAYNYNDTQVTGGTLNASATQRRLFEESRPRHNLTGTATYTLGRWQLLGRARYYGEWTDSTGNSVGDIFQSFGALSLFDVAATADLTDAVSVRVGAENVLDTYPDEAVFQASRGLIYSRNAPYDTDGGQYYVRLDVRF